MSVSTSISANKLIPVTIVTGFLGAGKTTLLRSLVERRQTRRLALLINEFGAVTIDGDLLRAEDDEQCGHVRVHDFPYGLIAYGDDELFIPTMLAIAARRAEVDHVLIETSGLALPTAAMELLQGPALAPHFILDATLAVVDTPLLLSDRFARAADSAVGAGAIAGMFEQQLEYADVVVLNKIDSLQEDDLLQAEQRVRQCAPNVRFLELAYQARLDIRLALGLRLHQPTLATHQHTYTPLPRLPGADSKVLADQQRLNGHVHSGLGAHSHGLATHKHFHEQDPGWLSFTLRSKDAQATEQLRLALVEAATVEPVLRTKGFVRAAGSGRALLVQGVRARVTIDLEQPAANDAGQRQPAGSELVFIGYHASRARVAALLSARTGTEWK